MKGQDRLLPLHCQRKPLKNRSPGSPTADRATANGDDLMTGHFSEQLFFA